MQIAICDDEPGVRDLIARKVHGIYPQAQLSLFASGEELLLRENAGDILFLDIRLGGQDGMEIARALRKKNRKTILIFVTAVRESVFQAFDVGAFHYLVKPFEDTKFSEVLRAAVRQWEEEYKDSGGNERADGRKDAGKENRGGGEPYRRNQTAENRYIWIKSGGLSTKVRLDDIIYAEVLNRKVTLHTKNGDLEYYGKLSELEKTAGEDFFRPHRAYLVNLKYVERYNATEIVLEKGCAIMAKQKYPEFVKCFMHYNQRKGQQGAYGGD